MGTQFTNKTFSGQYPKPPVGKEAFRTLVSLCSRDVVLSHDDYYKQIDKLAMGDPPAPLLANGWLKQIRSNYQGRRQIVHEIQG